MSWRTVTVGDVGSVYDGPHATPKPAESGPIFLGIKNIREDGHLDFSEVRHVSEQEYPKWTRRVVPHANDIVFTYEATLHRYAVIPEGFVGCLGRRTALVRPNPDRVDHRFLYYQFRSPAWRALMESNTLQGATVNRIPVGKFPGFEIRLPELEVQQRIADILTAYDDLIENNNRRMALLGEAVYLLYREWFVYLRFPGHDRVKVVDGVPEGWERCPFGSLLDFHIGGGWGKEEPDHAHSEPGFVIRGTDLAKVVEGQTGDVPFRYHKASNMASRRLSVGDVVFEVSGGSKTQGVGRSLVVTESIFDAFPDQVMCASFCKRLIPKAPYTGPFLQALLHQGRESGEVGAYESGSASNIINFRFKEFCDQSEVLLPPANLVEEFTFQATSLRSLQGRLAAMNRHLRSARDLLLPRLMNGSITV